MAKTKFTFKNYLKELRKQWIILSAFFVVGAAVGAYFSFSKPITNTAKAKISAYNSSIDNGSPVSPYSQISEFINSSKILLEVDDDITGEDIAAYEATESKRGVFEIIATDPDADKAIKTANIVADNAHAIIDHVYDDADNYKIIVLQHAEKASTSASKKSRFISTGIAAIGALVLAMIIVFIRFDYSSEK